MMGKVLKIEMNTNEDSLQGTTDVFAWSDGGNRAPGLGLFYFGARYYDPEIGMFIGPDPAQESWNSYGYCLGNPILFINPTGMVHVISQEAWEAGWATAENGQFNEMTAAAFEINSFGWSAFDAYLQDVDYGSKFFVNSIIGISVQIFIRQQKI
jgi:RHS repeat-associated protein